MKARKQCGNCRWYVPERKWCRMIGEEHKPDDPGGWWHEWADKAQRERKEKGKR